MPAEIKPSEFPEKFYDDPMGLDRYVVQEKILFAWQGPSKIEQTKQKDEVLRLLLLAVVIVLILFLFQEIFLAVVVAVFVFLYAIFEITPPLLLQYQVTTIGIKIDDKYFYWPQFTQFWFETKSGVRILHLRSVYPRLQVLKLIIQPDDESEIKTTIGKYLLLKKPQQSFFEKWLKKITSYLPLNLDPF